MDIIDRHDLQVLAVQTVSSFLHDSGLTDVEEGSDEAELVEAIVLTTRSYFPHLSHFAVEAEQTEESESICDCLIRRVFEIDQYGQSFHAKTLLEILCSSLSGLQKGLLSERERVVHGLLQELHKACQQFCDLLLLGGIHVDTTFLDWIMLDEKIKVQRVVDLVVKSLTSSSSTTSLGTVTQETVLKVIQSFVHTFFKPVTIVKEDEKKEKKPSDAGSDEEDVGGDEWDVDLDISSDSDGEEECKEEKGEERDTEGLGHRLHRLLPSSLVEWL